MTFSSNYTKTMRNGATEPTVTQNRTLLFGNGNEAPFVTVPRYAEASSVLRCFTLPEFGALLMISGGAGRMENNPELHTRLLRLFEQGVMALIAKTNVLAVSGGTDSGVMAMLGQAAARQQGRLSLIGVTPWHCADVAGAEPEKDAALVPLEPHHNYFVLVDCREWGQEIDVMYGLADVFARKAQIPVVTILVNGGALAREEVLRSVRLGIPVLIVEGSGRLADELAGLHKNPPASFEDPALEEIITRGKLHLSPLEQSSEEMENMVSRVFSRFPKE